jgi:hypothetical protein
VQINPREERLLEDGWYPAGIGEVVEKATKFGERLMVPFNVEADGEVVEITAFISFSDHPKSNIVRWGNALFGDGPFDTDDFTGQKCEVFVEEGEDNEGNPKNFIRKVRRPKSSGQARSKAGGPDDPEANFEDIPF